MKDGGLPYSDGSKFRESVYDIADGKDVRYGGLEGFVDVNFFPLEERVRIEVWETVEVEFFEERFASGCK